MRPLHCLKTSDHIRQERRSPDLLNILGALHFKFTGPRPLGYLRTDIYRILIHGKGKGKYYLPVFNYVCSYQRSRSWNRALKRARVFFERISDLKQMNGAISLLGKILDVCKAKVTKLEYTRRVHSEYSTQSLTMNTNTIWRSFTVVILILWMRNRKILSFRECSFIADRLPWPCERIPASIVPPCATFISPFCLQSVSIR